MTVTGDVALAQADACRLVLAAARPNTPRVDRERMARQMLMRLDGPDPRRAALLPDAASNLRNDTDSLRRLQAAREVILHAHHSPSSETAKPEHQGAHQ